MTSSEFRRQALGTIINALVWAAPLVFFVPYSPMHLRYEYWTVLAMLMTVSAVIVPTVPLSTLLFSTIVGCGSVVGFFTLLQPGMAGLRRCLLPRLRWARLRPRVIFCPRIWPLRAWRNAMKWSACSCANLTRMRLTGCGRPMRSAGFVPSRTVLPKRWAWRVPILMGPGLSLLSGPGGEGRAAEGRGVDRAGAPGIKELEEKLKARESFSNLLVRVMVQGTRRYWSLSGAPRHDDLGNFLGFRGVASDVTEQQETSEKIAYLARYDTLTGLPNRMMVIDALENALVAVRDGDGHARS
jgi:hypothetical protein